MTQTDLGAPIGAGRWIGARVRRGEDPRLLTGRATFIGDLTRTDLLHAAFVRSPHAHARILSIDTSAAMAMSGVVVVLTAAEVRGVPLTDRMRLEGLLKTPQPLLAGDRARFAGEAVAVVLAEDRYVAEDAAELVEVDYEPLPAVVDPDAASAPEAPVLFDDLGTNTIFRQVTTIGEPDKAFEEADYTASWTYRGNRFAAMPMEPRGCLASYDSLAGDLTMWSSTQCPHLLRNRLARTLDIPEHRVRVIAPAVGGGFGQKIPMHPEEGVIAAASIRLGRPVRWLEDRRENLVAGTHAKEQTITLEVAARSDGTLLAFKARYVGDVGAYSFNSASALVEPYLAAQLTPGVYRVQDVRHEVVAVLTNKAPISPYRGVGWTAGQVARELLLDRVAHDLGLDPIELRRKNMIRSDEFPYRSCTGMVYDSGSYLESLNAAVETIGSTSTQADGRLVGVGFSPYVEPGGWGSEGGAQANWPFASHDLASVTVDPSGNVTAAVGTASQGQGHETVLAQVVADVFDIEPSNVTVLLGDTSQTPFGIGARASRTAVVSGGALTRAAQQVREKLVRIAAFLLEAGVDDVVLEDSAFHVRGAPDQRVTLMQVAEAAYFSPAVRAVDPEPMLSATAFYDPKATYSNGCIAVQCEVDPETGLVQLLQLGAAEDCGTVLNPSIVEGQIQGAVAQGVGGALFEDIIYDDEGQLLTASMMDYLLPGATEMTDLSIQHLESPSPFTVGGVKGMGESGLLATPAAVANAVLNALGLPVTDDVRLPLTPERVRNLAKSTREHSAPFTELREAGPGAPAVR